MNSFLLNYFTALDNAMQSFVSQYGPCQTNCLCLPIGIVCMKDCTQNLSIGVACY